MQLNQEFYFWLSIHIFPQFKQAYLSLQQKAKTTWRHPWSWATSKGGGSSWTVGCSSRCSHILTQQLQIDRGGGREIQGLNSGKYNKNITTVREKRKEKRRKRNLCYCRRLGNLELKRLWLMKGSPWSGFFCTSDTCAATNNLSQTYSML